MPPPEQTPPKPAGAGAAPPAPTSPYVPAAYASCPAPADRLAYTAGRLTAGERDRVRNHLAGCARCRRELQDRAAFAGVLGSAPATAVPPVITGYRIGHWLGSGGSGVVWYAEEEQTGLPLAIKVLLPDRIGTLRAEAHAVRSLPPHPHRVRAYPAPGGAAGLVVMDYIPGGSLGLQAPLPWARSARYVAQAADALVAVHEVPLAHGDVTPSNLLRDDRRDACLVSDFGLSTAGGVVGGTRGFAAPELRDGVGGPPADVFGLAATLCHLLTGRAPFDAPTLPDSLALAARGLPADFLPPSVPAELAAVIREATDPDPERRPKVVRFRDRLNRLLLAPVLDRLSTAAVAARAGVPLGVAASVWSADGTRLLGRSRWGTTSGAGDLHRELEGETDGCVECDVSAGRPGYLTAVIASTAGEIVTVPIEYPPDEAKDLPRGLILPGHPARLALVLREPSGTDEVAFVWSGERPPPSPTGWLDLVGSGADADRAIEVVPLPSHCPPLAVVRLTISHARG